MLDYLKLLGDFEIILLPLGLVAKVAKNQGSALM
jgi:hypothetical protein